MRPMLLRAGAGVLVALAAAAPLPAQAQSGKPTFRFSAEAGASLRGLWESSVAQRVERVACLASIIRSDTVFVTRVAELDSEDADSMGVSAMGSVEQCSPPEWSGTVHTHITLYTDELPSTRFSAQDRIVMRLWYDRWHADGVFCVLYSREYARCEADGVVGGARSRPSVLR
jgi:hypothetical protein